MNGFIKAANKPVESIASFLRDSADNSIKYKPESGKKHLVYFPYREVQDENGNVVKSVIAMRGDVHELVPKPNDYDACVCMHGIVIKAEDGTLLNDGSCPYCDRVNDSYEIFKYKSKVAEDKAKARGLTGTELEETIKDARRRFMRETPVGKAKPYLYMLIVQYKLNAQDNPEIGPDGLPVFELKVMKLSDKGITKIQETFQNSGIALEGSEAVFKYQVQDNAMLVAGSRTVSPVFQGKLMDKYPGLKNAIKAAVDKWDWDGLGNAFKEWKGKSVAEAKAQCDTIFKAWDDFQKDPSVGYLSDESKTGTNPALPGATAPVNTPVQTNTPVGQTTPQMGFGGAGFGGVDPNAAFGNMPTL